MYCLRHYPAMYTGLPSPMIGEPGADNYVRLHLLFINKYLKKCVNMNI